MSENKINNIVDDMMMNERINTIIPDYIEKQIYTNALNALDESIKKLLETITFEILGSRYKLVKVEPDAK